MNAFEVRRAATRIQAIADDVRGLAASSRTAAAEGWRSTAAEGFRQLLAAEIDRVQSAAGELEDAAAALRRHAAAVEAVRVDPARVLIGFGWGPR